ncbi:MAG: flagellar biosynthetic protein FliQ [Planctomycetaceae bacterium]|jgi:flagellar biosynthetic protein FliQ|nr:flagellar biosynthetic protein FliQ [Phycisphaerales bacterium]MCE2653749.1 flagellar biosynthetic protein FliQ [Planctomycetaceae bacterium]
MHYDESVLEVVRMALLVTLKIAGPILLAGLVIGLVISILQAVTSIQDQALTFVPKIVVMIVASALLLPWLVARVVAFTKEMFLLHI